MLAGSDRPGEHGRALWVAAASKKIARSLGRASAASRSVVQSSTACARAMAATRSASRPTSMSRGTMRSSPTASPPSSRIGTSAFAQMLRGADAAGRAVQDDADRLACHGRCYTRSPRPDAIRLLPAMTALPRHIVCLTFDFDTQSGFIARGMTTPRRSRAASSARWRRAASSTLCSRAASDRPGSPRLHHRELAAGMRGGARGRP